MTILKSFEKPLTPEEEVYYLNLLKNENNKEAKEVLVQRNMRLVAHISKKYNNIIEKLGDKNSEAVIFKRNLTKEKIEKLKNLI